MTHSEKVNSITLIAGAAVVRNRFVTMGANGKVAPIAAQGVDSIGVALSTLSAQNITDGVTALAVCLHDGGILPMEAGAAIVISGGAVPVTCDNLGRVVGLSSDNDRILGYALEAAGAAGELISVLLVKASGQGGAAGSFLVASGKHTTAGGDANEAIVATGAVASDVALVTLQTPGAVPRTVLNATPGTNVINVVMSGDPAADHILSWIVVRAS